jgi:hypothetical protein
MPVAVVVDLVVQVVRAAVEHKAVLEPLILVVVVEQVPQVDQVW